MRRGDALGSEAQKMVAKGGGTNYWVDFDWDNDKVSFAEILEAVGELPIPPYLNRKTEESDKTTYQTVYSKSREVWLLQLPDFTLPMRFSRILMRMESTAKK